ncbi:unnamed protein product [Peniophora sp. CBMAI 1063]|nr:laccase 3B [Peniophora sp. CBMAI 1063]VDC05858.1 unnamed protein product [Peniophora sp. CBMAI 1063]
MRVSALLSLIPFLVSESLAAVVQKTLTLSNEYRAPDGFNRSVTLINGQEIGPVIVGQVGDRYEINVVNQLTDKSLDLGTTIHWHGIFQGGSNEYDGVADVTQCPIIPGESFLYNFTVPEQYGTYWYHSHYKTQYCDGVRGVFVIYDPNDPHKALYDVDDETTILTLSDWYHFPGPQHPVITFFNSTLINGRGRYQDAFGSDLTVPLSIVSVEQGVRYRMRIVSLSCDPNFTFSIDGHNMTVIEVEGVNTQPLVVDQMQLFTGQRVSVVLNADQPVDNYWIRSFPQSASANALAQTYDNGLNQAILRYKGAPEVDPTTTDDSGRLPLIETNLHPLEAMPVPGTPAPGAADINIRLDLKAVPTGFTVNDVQFAAPSVPILLQILSGAADARSLLPAGAVYELERNKTVELVIPSGSNGGPHPMHLHGQNFWVVRSASNSSYNFVDPIVRDVVSIGNATAEPYDEVTIRFNTDNPGPWIFHCHIDWHLDTGLAVVFTTAKDEVPEEELDGEPAQAWENLCPAYDHYMELMATTP